MAIDRAGKQPDKIATPKKYFIYKPYMIMS